MPKTRKIGNRQYYFSAEDYGASGKASLQRKADNLKKKGFFTRIIQEGKVGNAKVYKLFVNPAPY